MKKLLSILTLLVPGILMAQLDVPTSQYLSNQATFNPAYTGIHGVTSFNLNSRLQWAGIEGAPLTNTFNVHTSLLNDKLGAGLLFVNDSYGINSNNEIHLSYSYKIELRNMLISMGLQTGMVSFRYDYAKLNTEFSDPTFIESGESFSKPNFGAGIFIQSDNYFLGFSVPKFMNIVVENGSVNSTRYRRHFYVTGGYLFDKSFAFKLKPSFLFRTVDGGYTALDLNLSALVNERVWVGTSLRNFGDALNLHSIIEVNEALRAGMSFEISSKTFSGANYGTYEIMVSYDFGSLGNRYW